MEALFEGFLNLTWQIFIMYAVGGTLIFLAVKKDYEPMLLLPIGFGAILVNLPFAAVWEYDDAPGVLQILFDMGIMTELFPVLIFLAVGAMIDFTPLLNMPKMLFLGAAAQFGIFATAVVVAWIGTMFPELGLDLKAAASIGIIGAADGPTSIFVSAKF
ncbi:MAG: sodium ion-translocating decarboxylase subunit beta, partial [Nocardiopsaceae bacterium]|nr:sodium ion-translocating decarboxylase subunit beta [Nocardiopsaceae bacterium]